MKILRLTPLFACILAGACVGCAVYFYGTGAEPALAGTSVYAILFALYTIKSSR
jgi:hypothetical protein